MASVRQAPIAARSPRSGNAGEDRARAQQAADLGPLLGAPLVRAVRVGRFALVSGEPKRIPHGLGRELVGWLVSRPSAQAMFREVSASAELLEIESAGDVTFDLWVW